MADVYKVVKIISDYEIVINAGSKQYLTKDQELEIYVPGEEVTDPETGETLGTLDTIKAYLIVKHVFDKMCICENADSVINNPLLGFSEALATHSRRRLNVDTAEISGGLNLQSRIKIGDLVRKSKG